MQPTVSVVVLAFNHERFIVQALESVLGQRTTFPVEIIISEDCSTDGTREIAHQYALRHPDRIRVMFSDVNLNSNYVLRRAVADARGDYIAILDADDYWTSDEKLQAQIEFLQAFPDCSVCFHDAIIVDAEGLVIDERYLPPVLDTWTSVDDILTGNYVPSCSMVFRRQAISPLPDWFDRASFGDWPMLILAARRGRLGVIHRTLGAYRRHSGGVWSSLSRTEQIRGLVHFLDFIEQPLGAEFATRVRRARARWRVHLLNFLDERGENDLAAQEVTSGVRQGDIGFARSDEPRTAIPTEVNMLDARPGIAVALHPARDIPQPSDEGAATGYIDDVRLSRGGTLLVIQGWAAIDDNEYCPVIEVDSTGDLAEAAIVRLPRPDVARLVDPAFSHSGYWLRILSENVIRFPIRLSSLTKNGRRQLLGLVHPPPASDASKISAHSEGRSSES